MAARKPKSSTPQYTPIEPAPGEKPHLSAERQIQFVALLSTLSPEQRQGAIIALNTVTQPGGPGIAEGYKRFMHWWKIYSAQLNVDNVQL